MEIINMQIKAYVVCFPAIYKTQFLIFVTYITFSQSGSHISPYNMIHKFVTIICSIGHWAKAQTYYAWVCAGNPWLWLI